MGYDVYAYHKDVKQWVLIYCYVETMKQAMALAKAIATQTKRTTRILEAQP